VLQRLLEPATGLRPESLENFFDATVVTAFGQTTVPARRQKIGSRVAVRQWPVGGCSLASGLLTPPDARIKGRKTPQRATTLERLATTRGAHEHPRYAPSVGRAGFPIYAAADSNHLPPRLIGLSALLNGLDQHARACRRRLRPRHPGGTDACPLCPCRNPRQGGCLARTGDEIGLTMDVRGSGRPQIVSALVPIPSAQARLHPLIAVRLGSYRKLVTQVAECSFDLRNKRDHIAVRFELTR